VRKKGGPGSLRPLSDKPAFSVKFNEMEATHTEHDKTGKPGSPVVVKFNVSTEK